MMERRGNMKIVEKRFRGSIICRVLGYPISYGIVKLLLKNGKMNLKAITKSAKRSEATVCYHLTKLRLANLVRYEKEGRNTIYWIKYLQHTKELLDISERLAVRISQRLDRDF